MYLLRPPNIEHFKIIFHDTNFLFLVRLVEVLENDGDVHVDDDHIADNDEGGEVGDGQQRAAAVAVGVAVIT